MDAIIMMMRAIIEMVIAIITFIIALFILKTPRIHISLWLERTLSALKKYVNTTRTVFSCFFALNSAADPIRSSQEHHPQGIKNPLEPCEAQQNEGRYYSFRVSSFKAGLGAGLKAGLGG